MANLRTKTKRPQKSCKCSRDTTSQIASLQPSARSQWRATMKRAMGTKTGALRVKYSPFLRDKNMAASQLPSRKPQQVNMIKAENKANFGKSELRSSLASSDSPPASSLPTTLPVSISPEEDVQAADMHRQSSRNRIERLPMISLSMQELHKRSRKLSSSGKKRSVLGPVGAGVEKTKKSHKTQKRPLTRPRSTSSSFWASRNVTKDTKAPLSSKSLRKLISSGVGRSISALKPSLLPNLIQKAREYRSAQREAKRLKRSYWCARKPADEWAKRIEKSLGDVSQKIFDDDRLYGTQGNRLEWIIRENDLNDAWDLMDQDLNVRGNAMVAAREEVGRVGEELIGMVKSFAGGSASDRTKESDSEMLYDPPFPMALIETTNQRCADQTAQDLKEEETLRGLPYQNEFQPGGKHILSTHLLNELYDTTKIRDEFQDELNDAIQYKADLDAGVSQRHEYYKENTDMNAIIKELEVELGRRKKRIAALVCHGRKLGLDIANDGTVVCNPYPPRKYPTLRKDTGGNGEDRRLTDEDVKKLDEESRRRVKAWWEKAEFGVPPDRAATEVPKLGDDGLVELENFPFLEAGGQGCRQPTKIFETKDLREIDLYETLSEKLPERKINLGYTFWEKQIKQEEADREARRRNFDEDLFMKDEYE